MVSAAVNMRVMVKLSVAKSSGKLDLSDCGLTEVPAEELSLAGNQLTALPEGIGNLQSLNRLQLSGNYLQHLPDSLCQLASLQGFWAHGNLLASLPQDFGKLTNLHTISLAGNKLTSLPKSISGLVNLRDLGLQGNELTEVPAEVGALSSLLKLTINGNQLRALAPECGQLTNLKELHLQGNQLAELPTELYQLSALETLSVADNHLHTLRSGISSLTSLKQFWAYGNHLQNLPPDILDLPAIQNMWVEGNPLQPQSLVPLLRRLASEPPPEMRELGLDADQVQGIEPRVLDAAKGVRVGEVFGHGVGYFKLQFGDAPSAEDTPQGERLLVVSFGSAPGLPNWGGLLKKVYNSMTQPALRHFDTLYVVDPTRSWYYGGDDRFDDYFDRLSRVTSRYKRVVMLGDSMGASAALLFSPLATAVQAFSPQVDLTASSIRPAIGTAEMTVLQQRLIQKVSESNADITVHVSSWEHDTDQGALLPKDKVSVQVYGFADHRLAFYLDEINQLELLLKNCMLVQQGFKVAEVALAV
ncbi:hypothetical protein ABBQ38_009638 [Trebouxia sp. C0009 RCD-2024]